MRKLNESKIKQSKLSNSMWYEEDGCRIAAWETGRGHYEVEFEVKNEFGLFDKVWSIEEDGKAAAKADIRLTFYSLKEKYGEAK